MNGIRGGCGGASCSVSTGIHEGLTFGRGALDDHGFWEDPCGECARAWEAKYPEDAPCWPYAAEQFTSEDRGGK